MILPVDDGRRCNSPTGAGVPMCAPEGAGLNVPHAASRALKKESRVNALLHTIVLTLNPRLRVLLPVGAFCA
jgi:hypothetical protein